MSFPCPTVDEIQAAHDAISKDGPGAEATTTLAMLPAISPALREATKRKVELLTAFFVPKKPEYDKVRGGAAVRELMDEVAAEGLDTSDVLITGMIASLTMYGLNLGIRVGEARREGLRSRQSIENLLTHIETDCPGTEAPSDDRIAAAATRESAIRVLRWVLGEQVQL